MNIVFLYAKGNESWSTPHSLITEFVKRGHKVYVVNLLGPDGRLTSDNLINFINCDHEDVKPDMIIHCDFGQYDTEFLHKRHVPYAFWAMEAGDEPQNFDKNLLKAYKFDYVFTPDIYCNFKYSQNSIKSDWLPHWADTEIYKPLVVEQKFKAVSSRGQGGSQFLDYLEQLTNGSFINRNGFMGMDHAIFLNSAPIVIQNSRFGEITRRIFEAMACKRLVITDRLPSVGLDDRCLDKLFKENESIVLYDNIRECVSKLNYYSARPELAAQIADNGYNEVLKNHTQVNRVDKILERYGEWKAKN